MVEELFPASVSVVAEVDVDERVVPGLDGLFNEFHGYGVRPGQRKTEG